MAVSSMRFLFLALCILVAAPAVMSAPLKKTFVTNTLAPAIKNLINTWPKKVILGGVVRLTFHDCAGSDGCNGCVNTALPENAGLDDYVDGLESLYQNMSLSGNLSRADFWALSGIVAVNIAMKRNAPAGFVVPALLDPKNFKYGRKDCGTSPKSTTDQPSDFPSAFLGSSGVTDYFSKRFGFNAQQTVAIMGAHHVGRMHQDYSGFNGPWVPAQAMDGQYYKNLMNVSANWHQKVVNCSLRPYDIKVQWVDNRGSPCLNMLNADMALYKDIGVAQPNGAVQCTYSTCPAATATKDWVATYASNAATFQDAFASVYTMMLSVCSHAASGAPSMCTLANMV